MDSPYSSRLLDPPPPTTPPTVFRYPAQTQWMAIGKLVGGIMLALFALGMLALHILIIHPSTLTLHATTTAPMIMGVFLISAAMAALRNGGQIELTDQAIVFQPGPRIAWQEIAFASVDEIAGGQQKQLRLLDHAGKKLAQVPDTIENFTELVAEVRKKVEQHTPQEITANVRKRKARRQALLTAGGTLLMFMAGTFIILDAVSAQDAEQKLATVAIEGAGVVREKLVAPNGVTHRIRYSVAGTHGSEAEHNVEVSPSLYGALAVGDTVAVRYVPDAPEISRLVDGEIRDTGMQDSPAMSQLLGAAAIVMSLFLAAVTVMLWKGYDFKIDNEGARFVPLGD